MPFTYLLNSFCKKSKASDTPLSFCGCSIFVYPPTIVGVNVDAIYSDSDVGVGIDIGIGVGVWVLEGFLQHKPPDLGP